MNITIENHHLEQLNQLSMGHFPVRFLFDITRPGIPIYSHDFPWFSPYKTSILVDISHIKPYKTSISSGYVLLFMGYPHWNLRSDGVFPHPRREWCPSRPSPADTRKTQRGNERWIVKIHYWSLPLIETIYIYNYLNSSFGDSEYCWGLWKLSSSI